MKAATFILCLQLPLDLNEKIESLLSHNDKVVSLQLLCKASHEKYMNMKIRLSQPVPQHAYQHRWGKGSKAWRELNWEQRLQLVLLTAASGVIDNLELALSATGCALTWELFQAAAVAGHLHVCQWLHAQGCPWSDTVDVWGHSASASVFPSAAAAGQLHICKWLREQGCPYNCHVLAVVAEAGKVEVFFWLLEVECPWDASVLCAAAENGHVQLLDPLLQRPEVASVGMEDIARVLAAAARGCNLPTLQRVFDKLVGAREQDLGELRRLHADKDHGILSGAASSPTPDWQEKTEWLLGLQLPYKTCFQPLPAEGALDRLWWLLQQEFRLDSAVVKHLISTGDAEVLDYLLGPLGGVPTNSVSVNLLGDSGMLASSFAAYHGVLPSLKVLHRRGWEVNHPYVVYCAARGGHLDCIDWLADTFYLDMPAVAEAAGRGGKVSLFGAGLDSGNPAVAQRLLELGCGWTDDGEDLPDAEDLLDCYSRAAGRGDTAMLGWMAKHHVPMAENPWDVYSAAGKEVQVPTLFYLRDVLLPDWRPTYKHFKVWLWGYPLMSRQWLVDEGGCSVDWDHAASLRYLEQDVREWIQEQQQLHQGPPVAGAASASAASVSPASASGASSPTTFSGAPTPPRGTSSSSRAASNPSSGAAGTPASSSFPSGEQPQFTKHAEEVSNLPSIAQWAPGGSVAGMSGGGAAPNQAGCSSACSSGRAAAAAAAPSRVPDPAADRASSAGAAGSAAAACTRKSVSFASSSSCICNGPVPSGVSKKVLGTGVSSGGSGGSANH